jgi:hypothetical protein
VILVSSPVREDHNPHQKRVETGRGPSVRLISCYSEICLNRTYFGPTFVFKINRFSVYTGIIKKYFLQYDFI